MIKILCDFCGNDVGIDLETAKKHEEDDEWDACSNECLYALESERHYRY